MKFRRIYTSLIVIMLICNAAEAALSVNRSRFIFDEDQKSLSVLVKNTDKVNPYLVQGWLEDSSGKKVPGPMMVLPPLQRIEPGEKTLVRIQALPDVKMLPKDRESLFYFNIREIPPKSNKPNVLTLAMQTRLKVFWRPNSLKVDPNDANLPSLMNLTLHKTNDGYQVNNPMPYHITFIEVKDGSSSNYTVIAPLMVAPLSSSLVEYKGTAQQRNLGLVFVNDFGSKQVLNFKCERDVCSAVDITNYKQKMAN